eukprot:9311737-Pyramimonas_sp.AAC.1
MDKARAQLVAFQTERAQLCADVPGPLLRLLMMVMAIATRCLRCARLWRRQRVKQEEAERAEAVKAEPAGVAGATDLEAGGGPATAEDVDMSDAELEGASTAEFKAYLEGCGLKQLAGGTDDDDELRDAVKRCLKAPTWQEVKRRRTAGVGASGARHS